VLWPLSALVLALLCFSACVSTIEPPDAPFDPCKVYLLKSAKHVGLVLPDLEGGYVEYGYGDWSWFALMRDSWYNAFDTVLWPTQGCLGRRRLAEEAIRTRKGMDSLDPLMVERDRVRALLQTLGERFDRDESAPLENEVYDMTFKRDEQGFWIFYNCRDAVADWMEELGCEVSWVPLRLGIDVDVN
jgi:hypothetical protein